jgi:hypothetical protein
MYAFNGRDLLMIEKVFSVTNVWNPGPEESDAPEPGQPFAVPENPDLPPADFVADPPADDTVIDLNGGGIVIRGSGYGHGMGMSQHGARQLAASGQSYGQILKYFYSGVELVSWSGEIVDVPEGDTSSFYEPFVTTR